MEKEKRYLIQIRDTMAEMMYREWGLGITDIAFIFNRERSVIDKIVKRSTIDSVEKGELSRKVEKKLKDKDNK